MRRNSFTLAEILVTLTIIGIVASMTIPGLIKSYEEKEIVSQFLKSYAMLRQASLMITADCDGNILNCISDYTAENDDSDARSQVAALYKNKFKVAKDCATGSGCLSSSSIKYLSGETDTWLQDNQTNIYKMILNDGKSLAINWNGFDYSSGNSLYILHIDLNGKKSPNQWGRDIFAFAYNLNTGDLEPVGKTVHQGTCNTSGSGYACAQKVLLEKAITY